MDAMLVVDMQVGLLNGEPFGCPFLFFLVFQGTDGVSTLGVADVFF
jgi:hypothetical protein